MNTTKPVSESLETPQPDTQSRGEFLRSLGLSSAALMAFYCLGTSSCKSSDDPAPSAPTPQGNGVTGNASTASGAINFTVDLTNSNYSNLKTKGQSAKVGDVFLANATAGYIALSKLCTHNNLDTLTFRASTNDILCTTHGSEFKVDGSVNKGPAGSPLTRYTATVSADGNTLTVKA